MGRRVLRSTAPSEQPKTPENSLISKFSTVWKKFFHCVENWRKVFPLCGKLSGQGRRKDRGAVDPDSMIILRDDKDPRGKAERGWADRSRRGDNYYITGSLHGPFTLHRRAPFFPAPRSVSLLNYLFCRSCMSVFIMSSVILLKLPSCIFR